MRPVTGLQKEECTFRISWLLSYLEPLLRLTELSFADGDARITDQDSSGRPPSIDGSTVFSDQRGGVWTLAALSMEDGRVAGRG